MKLSKIDLKNIVAIGHSDGQLGLLLNRGEEIEYVEITAPKAAYQGLQQIDFLANNKIAELPASLDAAELPPKEQAIAMLPVSSSMAKGIGYDEERKILQVEFNNGSVYQYSHVENETWEGLSTADSTGRFFNKEIKGTYECQRLNNTTITETATVVYSVSWEIEVE